jgi:atypical dual specificity phosphatase
LLFYWLIENVLAGCSRPGGRDGNSASVTTDLTYLRQRGIRALLSLTETPLDAEVLARHDLEVLHLPVPDMTAPLPAQLAAALRFLDVQRMQDKPVAVHCLMGQGRTATILAAHLIRAGWSSEEAVGRLRQLCPGAIESPDQVRALHAFHQERAWVL